MKRRNFLKLFGGSAALVNFTDFAELAKHWLDTKDIYDLAEFADSWLEEKAQIVLSRDSVAYDHKMHKLGLNEPRTRQIAVANRAECEILPYRSDVRSYAVANIGGIEHLLCRLGNESGSKIFSTTDGENFSEVADLSNIKSWDGGTVNSIAVLPDGSWLVPAGMSLHESGRGSSLYRRDPEGNWSKVLETDAGWPAIFSWTAIRDNEVAFGCYGSKVVSDPATQTPISVYYSDDYGQTWARIYRPDYDPEHPLYERNAVNENVMHAHSLVFHPEHTNSLYIAYGDHPINKIWRIDYVQGDGGKLNPDNWYESEENPIYWAGPVGATTFNGWIYWGHDNQRYEATIYRMHPDTYEVQNVCTLGRQSSYSDANRPTRMANNTRFCFAIEEYQGLLYATVNYPSIRSDTGLLVSPDGENWTMISRTANTRGPRHIAGFIYGKAWCYMEGDGDADYVVTFDLSDVEAVVSNAFKAERGAHNILPASSSYTFEYKDGNPGRWRETTSSDLKSIERSQEEALFGDYSLKITSEDTGAEQVRLRLPNYVFTDGDLIVMSLYYKAAPSTPPMAYIGLHRLGGMIINASEGSASIGNTGVKDGWQRLAVWGRATGGNAALEIRIDTTLAKDYGYDIEDIVYYIDGVQITKAADIHHNTGWIPGGTSRADEYGYSPMMVSSNEWTSSFIWRPRFRYMEIAAGTNFPIATWVGQNGDYLELYYERSEKRFRLTDGASTASSEIVEFEWYDTLKFILANGDNAKLYIEATHEGQLPSINIPSLESLPTEMLLNANYEQTILGMGLFANIRHLNKQVNNEKATEFFNTPDLLRH